MTTCPTCGTETDKAVCEVDGTTLAELIAALNEQPVEAPAEDVAEPVPAPKKRKGKS